jgi:8-oxo-dGTP diphosphatase
MRETSSSRVRVLDEREFESKYPAFSHYQWARIGAIGIVARNGKILLLHRRGDLDLHPGLWGLPGGGLEKGEGLENALVREVREETGLPVRVGRSVDTWFEINTLNSGERVPFVIACYECITRSTKEPRLDKAEHTEYVWSAPEDLGKYPLLPRVLWAAKGFFSNRHAIVPESPR